METLSVSKKTELKYQDRVKELIRLKGSEIRMHPKNPRRHPSQQLEALRGAFREIGLANVVLVFRHSSGDYMLIDGEGRLKAEPDAMWPCVVLDVDDAEAEKILATLDQITNMAEIDVGAFASLVEKMDFESDALNQMLAEIAGDGINPTEIVQVPAPPPPPKMVWLLAGVPVENIIQLQGAANSLLEIESSFVEVKFSDGRQKDR
jgi:hypothetical protein